MAEDNATAGRRVLGVIGRAMIERFPIDWAAQGFSSSDLDELVEQMLRMTQSLVVDPGTPPRTGAALRD